MDKLRTILAWLWEPPHRFIPLFLGCLWILTKLSEQIPKPLIQSFLSATTWVDYQLIHAFSDKVSQHGTTLTLDGFAVQIITECTGLFEAVILVAAVLSYKASWREKVIGILLGTSCLYLINVIRIAFLLLVGRLAPKFFNFAHVYFWQSLLIVFITAIWLGWIHYFVSDETSHPVRS